MASSQARSIATPSWRCWPGAIIRHERSDGHRQHPTAGHPALAAVLAGDPGGDDHPGRAPRTTTAAIPAAIRLPAGLDHSAGELDDDLHARRDHRVLLHDHAGPLGALE